MIFEDEDIAHISKGYSLIQKKTGFRFGTDALLLADFFSGKRDGKILEIGTGNGIIPILLCIKDKVKYIKTIEIQKKVYEIARRNIIRNGFEERIKIENIDVNNLSEGNSYDYIISNPPYMTLDGKEINMNSTKSIARHEIKLNLKQFIYNVKRLLKPRGELFMIHRSYRFLEIAKYISECGMSIKRVKFVYYSKSKNSSLVLIEASKGRKNLLNFETPIFLNDIL